MTQWPDTSDIEVFSKRSRRCLKRSGGFALLFAWFNSIARLLNAVVKCPPTTPYSSCFVCLTAAPKAARVPMFCRLAPQIISSNCNELNTTMIHLVISFVSARKFITIYTIYPPTKSIVKCYPLVLSKQFRTLLAPLTKENKMAVTASRDLSFRMDKYVLVGWWAAV